MNVDAHQKSDEARTKDAAAGSTATRTPATSEELLARMVALCHGMRGEQVVSLDVRALVQYTDFLLLVTGRSARQNRALASHVRQEMKRGLRALPLSMSGQDHGNWICLDYVDVVLHVFDEEHRAHYDLELLWADAVHQRHEAPAGSAAAQGANREDDDAAHEWAEDWAPVIEPPHVESPEVDSARVNSEQVGSQEVESEPE